MDYYVQPTQLMLNAGGAGSHGHYDRATHPPPPPSLLQAYYVQPNQLMLNTSGAGSHEHYDRTSKPPPHPSLLQTPMPSHWHLVDNRSTVRVPRPQGIDPSYQTIPCITFSTGGWPGVRVKDILRQNVVVDHPTDAIFARHGWRTTTLALEWPGFMPCSNLDPSRFRLEVLVNNKSMTRQEFAQQISYLVADVYDRAKGKPVAYGWEKWALSENGIRPADVIILSAHYYTNVWVPELYVIE